MTTVAVTGPTGEIGKPFIAALERLPEVDQILGMARRPFDPAAHGWTKTEYRQGDILDRATVDALVSDADVVVHLAFIIMTGGGDSREINLRGSRNVFEAVAAASVERFIYTSSVAAYGFEGTTDGPLTEDTPVQGTEAHPYSAEKAEVERALTETLDGIGIDTYIFRPCIVAGPDAQILLRSIPLIDLGRRLPAQLRALVDRVPLPKPVLPDSGVAFQLVHQDDVATALCAAVTGQGPPGIYNLAAEGEITLTDVAHELGWHAIPVPALAVEASAELVGRIPFLPPQASWVEVARREVLMDTSRARRELGWQPRHGARETLHQMVAARDRG